jgi:two-component system nitrate/nitrite response regulator NarL
VEQENFLRALWIEDHQLIGDSLEMLLQVVMPEVSVDKARDLEAAMRLVAEFQYELILLDWWLSGNDGERAMHALRGAGCDVPIVVVSGDERASVMARALSLGAVSYVPKSAEPTELVAAIRNVLGERTAAPEPGYAEEGRRPLSALQPEPETRTQGGLGVRSAFPELTSRQADVFRHLMRGLSDKQIARDLGVSDTTVKTHVRAILQIVGVRKRGEAAFEARVRGVGERG